MIEWLSRLIRLVGFVNLGYEPTKSTVVITVRLNAYFVQGAVLAAFFLTLIFKYGSISFASALELLSDLWRGGFWFWIGISVVLALVTLAMRREALAGAIRPSGLWPGLSRLIPQGTRGTAVLCLILLVLLMLLMWGASSETPQTTDPTGAQSPRALAVPEVQSSREETPSLWNELQKKRRP
jgi:hypothetical protein